MGMIQTIMKRVPEGELPQFLQKLQDRARLLVREGDSDGDRPEGAEVKVLAPEDFEEAWQDQENLKKEPDIKEKYKNLTQAGQVAVVEIDW